MKYSQDDSFRIDLVIPKDFFAKFPKEQTENIKELFKTIQNELEVYYINYINEVILKSIKPLEKKSEKKDEQQYFNSLEMDKFDVNKGIKLLHELVDIKGINSFKEIVKCYVNARFKEAYLCWQWPDYFIANIFNELVQIFNKDKRFSHYDLNNDWLTFSLTKDILQIILPLSFWYLLDKQILLKKPEDIKMFLYNNTWTLKMLDDHTILDNIYRRIINLPLYKDNQEHYIADFLLLLLEYYHRKDSYNNRTKSIATKIILSWYNKIFHFKDWSIKNRYNMLKAYETKLLKAKESEQYGELNQLENEINTIESLYLHLSEYANETKTINKIKHEYELVWYGKNKDEKNEDEKNTNEVLKKSDIDQEKEWKLLLKKLNKEDVKDLEEIINLYEKKSNQIEKSKQKKEKYSLQLESDFNDADYRWWDLDYFYFTNNELKEAKEILSMLARTYNICHLNRNYYNSDFMDYFYNKIETFFWIKYKYEDDIYCQAMFALTMKKVFDISNEKLVNWLLNPILKEYIWKINFKEFSNYNFLEDFINDWFLEWVWRDPNSDEVWHTVQSYKFSKTSNETIIEVNN